MAARRCVAAVTLLLLAACHTSGGSADRGGSKQQQQQDAAPADVVARAVALRDKPGASSRDQHQAATLLRDAAGLLSSSSSVSDSSATQEVPGFTDLAFAPSGNASALRELAKSYQRGAGVEVNHKLSLELFRRAAQLGDAEAQGALAWRMAVGLHHSYSFEGASIRHFGPPDEAAALLHFYFGAANGDRFSQAALGYRHTYGIGVPKSCWSAVAYYKPVAEAVVAEAVEGAKALGGPLGSSSGKGLPQIELIRLNVHASQGTKHDRHREVLQYYQYSADRGNADAQTAVATLLNIGSHGVTRDHAAAARYLAKAAAADNAEAMAHLGHMYGAGLGVAQDTAQALKYFRKAAAKSQPLGLYGLGYMHLSGTGVEQDYEAAFGHFTAAAEGGDRDAHYYLGAMYMHGLGMRRKSLNKAVLHFMQAANAGHIQAQFNVAMMHLAGRGTPRACRPALTNLKALVEKGWLACPLQEGHEAFFRGHHNQALLSYLQASELGMEVAQSNAAWMLQHGFSHAGPLGAAVSASLYRRSAEQGNTLSLLQLADAYYYGAGVEQDLVRAAAIYYEAYKGGSSEAMFALGYLHEYGAGVPRDFALSQRFYSMARFTNVDAALPVFLAQGWLKLHAGWEWARPRLPASVVGTLGWLFELPPPSASHAEEAAAAAVAALAQLPAAAAPAPAPGGSSTPSSDDAAASQPDAKPASPSAAHRRRAGSSGWLSWLPRSPSPLVWQWDSLVWRLTEAAGLAGLSVSSIMQEYADLGETLLLVLLLAVLLLVLHIRRQRQAALQRRVLAELAQPGQALRAQQLATELGLQLPPGQQQQQQAGGAAAAAAAAAVRPAAAAGGPTAVQQQQQPAAAGVEGGSGGGSTGSSQSQAAANGQSPAPATAAAAAGDGGDGATPSEPQQLLRQRRRPGDADAAAADGGSQAQQQPSGSSSRGPDE